MCLCGTTLLTGSKMMISELSGPHATKVTVRDTTRHVFCQMLILGCTSSAALDERQ